MTTGLIGILCAVCLILLILEKIRAVSDRKKIKHVIHVNGTRGKSATTRLIDAGLREAGFSVFSKTTGTLPMMIGTDGIERSVKRHAPASIREQLTVLHRAAKEGADVLCVECMAVQPEYQFVSQHRMLQADIGVITNVRLDHTEVMGETLSEIAKTLANTVPEGGVLLTAGENAPHQSPAVTASPQGEALNNTPVMTAFPQGEALAEQEAVHILEGTARRRGSRCVVVDNPTMTHDLVHTGSGQEESGNLQVPVMEHYVCKLADDELTLIDWSENVRMALAVCRELGVDEETALRGLRTRYIKDPYALSMYRLPAGALFVNAFAANDETSIRMIFERVNAPHQSPAVTASPQGEAFQNPPAGRRILLINTRADRAARTAQMARLAQEMSFDEIWLTGPGRVLLAGRIRMLYKKALDKAETSDGESIREGHYHKKMPQDDEKSDIIREDRGRTIRQFAKATDIDFSALAENDLVFATGNLAGAGIELMERVKCEGTEVERGAFLKLYDRKSDSIDCIKRNGTEIEQAEHSWQGGRSEDVL